MRNFICSKFTSHKDTIHLHIVTKYILMIIHLVVNKKYIKYSITVFIVLKI